VSSGYSCVECLRPEWSDSEECYQSLSHSKPEKVLKAEEETGPGVVTEVIVVAALSVRYLIRVGQTYLAGERSRSLTELTRQITPPTKNGHAPPPIELRKIFNLSIITMSGPGKFSRVESN
jgi:hypothetical protein